MNTKFGMIEPNKLIDHTFLKANATEKDIKKLCDEAKLHSFKSVCINPMWIEFAKQELKGTGVLVCTVIGFPLGSMTTETKVFETQNALEKGADEIDMVLNIGKLLDKEFKYVREEIKQIKRACGDTILKVIFENCLLNEDLIVEACKLSVSAGADFVKTSTGFNSGGATFKDVELMSRTVGNQAQVKAAGGVRSYDDLVKMVQFGATRIGTSSGVKLIKKETAGGGY